MTISSAVNWVVGLFADYDFWTCGAHSIWRTLTPSLTGSQKLDSQWSIGGRAGYLVLPQLLTYVSGGYTQGHWKSTNMSLFALGSDRDAARCDQGWLVYRRR